MCCDGSKLVISGWQPSTNHETLYGLQKAMVSRKGSVKCNSKAALKPRHGSTEQMAGRVRRCMTSHIGEGAPQGSGGSLVWLNAG